ncbi:hypothetical protein [Patulibacter americanus]|uniref:hypothetical protein n=1 Tax=Patulibacter americanus TaxID=588672 RepID=UPI0003B44A71|nr:hypothetical protein [Patulibacter americanus]
MPSFPRGLRAAVSATAKAHPQIAVDRGYAAVAPGLADEETAAWLDDALRSGVIAPLDAPDERDGTPERSAPLLRIPREWAERMTDDEIRTWVREEGKPDGRYPDHVVIRQEDIPDAHEEDIRAFLLDRHAAWEPLDAAKAEAFTKDTRPGEELPAMADEPLGFWVLPAALDR